MNSQDLHQQLTELGFERVEYGEHSTYQQNIVCQKTGVSYPLFLKISASEQGNPKVHFDGAYFEDQQNVPEPVRNSAAEKLAKLEQLLLNSPSVEGASNGSMARNFAEMKKLGNEIEKAKTGSDLLEENLTPDPLQ